MTRPRTPPQQTPGQPPQAPPEQWLTVHEACALIGVAPATLRRWSAAGDVAAFTTPGGHRRFARSTILALLPTAHQPRPNLRRLGETPEHMTRVYRRQLAGACHGVSWLADLPEDQLEPLRDHGRAIAGSLLAHLDATTPHARKLALTDALGAASEYGRLAAHSNGNIGETVATFGRFRMLFLTELANVAHRRALDTEQATDLLVTATQAIDQLLDALINAHQTHLADTPPTSTQSPMSTEGTA